MLFGSILKKKIREDQIANIFTNSIIKSVDEGFTEVASLINEAPEFVRSPEIRKDDSSKFLMIVIAGNLKIMSANFSAHEEARLMNHILGNFARIFQIPKDDLYGCIKDYQTFISKVNHPSNNLLYGMSKSIFHKYNLSSYQEDHFKKLNSPNPLFLKRMDEVMESFIWDWDHLKENYNLVIR